MSVLVLEADGGRFGVPIGDVVEVVWAVAVSPLPGAPPAVLGLIDLRGQLVPVYDLGTRLGRPPRPLDPAERFVIVRDGGRTVALRAQRVETILELGREGAGAVVDIDRIAPADDATLGAASTSEGVVLVQRVGALIAGAGA